MCRHGEVVEGFERAQIAAERLQGVCLFGIGIAPALEPHAHRVAIVAHGHIDRLLQIAIADGHPVNGLPCHMRAGQ